jgi:hypothetical protein
MTTAHTDRLGYYRVGKKKFYNKTLALLESYRVGYKPVWVFNDDVYSAVDWTVPIVEDLSSIYRRRAQQLRDQYDYLVLYFSGGADSTNILHAFIDNNIHLDEIVMQLPELVKPKLNTTDLSNGNIHSEIEYSAAPHLNQYSRQLAKTVIKYQDFSKNVIELLEKDNWAEVVPMTTNITVSGIGRQLAPATDDAILQMCGRGKKVAQIIGIDKPLVYCDGQDYFGFFLDLNVTHSPAVDITYANSDNELLGQHYITEFFYWTPDMPEIVVKQAQEIKQQCELNPNKKRLWMNSHSKHISEFRSVMHPIIYPSYTEPTFQTDKPTSKIKRWQDQWFWDTASTRVIGNYMDVINYLKTNINDYHTIDNDIMNGLKGHKSRYYKL